KSLTYFSIAENQIDSLPNLNGLNQTVQTNGFKVNGNRLTFNDILPNRGNGTTLQYYDQAKVGQDNVLVADENATLKLELNIDYGVKENIYKWYKDGKLAKTSYGIPSVVLSKLQTSDAGVYTCKVSNIALPMLVLESARFQVNVKVNVVRGNVKRIVETDFPAGQRLENWLVRLKKANNTPPIFGKTDAEGNYEIVVADSGQFSLQLLLPNNYWAAANAQDTTFTFKGIGNLVQKEFKLRTEQPYPLLEVDLATPALHRGKVSDYIVQVRNMGTVNAPTVRVNMTFDPYLKPTFSTAKMITDNAYSIEGGIASGETKTFIIKTLVDINAPLGATHTVKAHVMPDDFYLPQNPDWKGENITLSARCEKDSVAFFIGNQGLATANGITYSIIEEDLITEPGEGLVIAPNTTFVTKYKANGHTFRLIAQPESPKHPFLSYLTVAIEGCDSKFIANTTGYVTTFPEELDNNPFEATFALQNTLETTKFQTVALPKGRSAQHFIETTTPIEYLVPFQNNGLDIVKTVVILDTLDKNLDPSTLLPTVSNYPYTWDLLHTDAGQTVLKITYSNIQLPLGVQLETNYYGFFKFRIVPKSSVPFNTIIEHQATIWMDGVAQKTDLVFHTIAKPTTLIKAMDYECYSNFPQPPAMLPKGYFMSRDTVVGAEKNVVTYHYKKYVPRYKKHPTNFSVKKGESFSFKAIFISKIQQDTVVFWENANTNTSYTCDGYWLNISVNTSTSINELGDGSWLSLAPNPFEYSTTFTLHDVTEQHTYQIQIFDFIGKKILSDTFTTLTYTFENRDLARGSYFYRISSEGKQVAAGQMMKL
ncbi:MAG: hypothetical protein RLZZ292_2614, partial [Bacteroidota bacterium]